MRELTLDGPLTVTRGWGDRRLKRERGEQLAQLARQLARAGPGLPMRGPVMVSVTYWPGAPRESLLEAERYLDGLLREAGAVAADAVIRAVQWTIEPYRRDIAPAALVWIEPAEM